MEANEIEPWAGDEHSQALQELQRRHHDMGRAVLVGGFELQYDIAGAVTLESFIGAGGAGDVAAQGCVLGAPSTFFSRRGPSAMR